MFLVVGLGNPGKKYASNRHNVGFGVVDRLASAHGFPELKEKWKAHWAKGEIEGAPVAILKPQTYMNLSGESVQPAAAFLKIEPAKIIVVHDEIDLPWKTMRLKIGGGHAGNNGVRSITECLGTPEFIRVRIGVGRPPPGWKGEVADWVLSNFDAIEKAELPDVEARACDAVERIVASGLQSAMNHANTASK